MFSVHYCLIFQSNASIVGVDSRLTDDDDDPALLASLKEAIAYADAHPDEAKSIDEVRALIPQWISESKSQTRQ